MTNEFESLSSSIIFKREDGYCVIPKHLLLLLTTLKNVSAVSKFSSQERNHLNKKLASISKKLKNLENLLVDGFKIGGKKFIPYPNANGDTYIEKINLEWPNVASTLLMANQVEKRNKTSFPVDFKGWSEQLALHLAIAFVKKNDAKLFANRSATLATAESFKLLPPGIKLKNRLEKFVIEDLALSMNNVGTKKDEELLSCKKGERSTAAYKRQLEMAKRILKLIGPEVISLTRNQIKR